MKRIIFAALVMLSFNAHAINKEWATGLAILAAPKPTKIVWVKEGAGKDEFAKDKFICLRIAKEQGQFDQSMYDACMEAHGWEKRAE